MNTSNESTATGEEFEAIEDTYEELMESRKISMADIRDHLTGPMVSTIIHIIILAFLGTIIVCKEPEKQKELVITARDLTFPDIEPPPPPIPPPEKVIDDTPIDTPVVCPSLVDEVVLTFDDVSLDTADDIPLPNSMAIAISNSVLTMPVNPTRCNGPAVKCNFFNASSSGQRFLFILDYSASMSKEQSLVLKSHLIKALADLKGKGEIALLFFAGPTWLPEESGAEIKQKWGGGTKYDHFDRDGMSAFYPKVRWIVPNKHNLAILDKYICKSELVGGTNWSHPFRVALEQMKTKPDVIFFMTDGNVGQSISSQCIELVEKYGKNVTINTIGFGVTSGALQQLAELSKDGKFIGYSKGQLKSMAQGITLPSSFTTEIKFDYRIPKAVKIKKEADVDGLKIMPLH